MLLGDPGLTTRNKDATRGSCWSTHLCCFQVRSAQGHSAGFVGAIRTVRPPRRALLDASLVRWHQDILLFFGGAFVYIYIRLFIGGSICKTYIKHANVASRWRGIDMRHTSIDSHEGYITRFYSLGPAAPNTADYTYPVS